MNKKDIAHLKRQFKPDNERLTISDILNVYIMKESSEIYHYEYRPFAMLEREQQELYMINFKKMLSGSPDEKLFELRFQEDTENHTRQILHEALLAERTEYWAEQMLGIVAKLLEAGTSGHDKVVTFIRGHYYKPTMTRSEESEESDMDEVFNHKFLLCVVNKTEPPQKRLLFDYVEREFKTHISLDPIINLNTPEAGFLFPCFSEGGADVNHILYSASKPNEPDVRFIDTVLNAERFFMTAREERAVFEEIVKEVAGDQLDTSTLAHVYGEIHRIIDEHEEQDVAPTLDHRDVERVLTASGVEDVTSEKVERAYKQVVDQDHYELKAGNVMPKYTSKSIKIETKVATITVSPQDLRFIKQVQHQGKRCILIEVDEDTVIEGFTMQSEEL